MANENLKPCPFCGCAAGLTKEKIRYLKWVIGCSTKSCRGNWRESPLYDNPEEAEKAWNRRASMMERVSDDECIKVLEAAIGEAEYVIPENVITSAIYYIGEYQRLKIDESWDRCPERMGR